MQDEDGAPQVVSMSVPVSTSHQLQRLLRISRGQIIRSAQSSKLALRIHHGQNPEALFECQTPPLGVSVLACDGEQARSQCELFS